jgi:MoaA/NifB/PqqE/SkfB family radical SAM enzyme
MCSIWKQKDKKLVILKEAKKALKKLHKNNFGFLQITGGEPLLNPDFFEIVRYAKKLGFVVFIVTNGTLIDRKIAKKLARLKVDNVGISFHHYDKKFFEKISGHRDIKEKVLNTIKFLKEENVPTEALFTITKYNKDSIEKTVKLINSLGMSVSFCTPMIVRNTSYTLGNDSTKFSSRELKKIILKIISLKKNYFIANNEIFLREIIDFLEGKNKFYCLGGYKIFYLDWNLNFYPCMAKGPGIPLEDVNFSFDKKVCNECIFQCFREPSLALISKPLAIKFALKNFLNYLKLFRL